MGDGARHRMPHAACRAPLPSLSVVPGTSGVTPGGVNVPPPVAPAVCTRAAPGQARPPPAADAARMARMALRALLLAPMDPRAASCTLRDAMLHALQDGAVTQLRSGQLTCGVELGVLLVEVGRRGTPPCTMHQPCRALHRRLRRLQRLPTGSPACWPARTQHAVHARHAAGACCLPRMAFHPKRARVAGLSCAATAKDNGKSPSVFSLPKRDLGGGASTHMPS